MDIETGWKCRKIKHTQKFVSIVALAIERPIDMEEYRHGLYHTVVTVFLMAARLNILFRAPYAISLASSGNKGSFEMKRED